MYVDGCGSNGFMSKESFDSQKVRTILVQMGSESMPESVCGDPVFPTESRFLVTDMGRHIL